MNSRNENEITKDWSINSQPLVTIDCCTFNHENFICETIDSFLMQKTTFPFEIIMHDDASTDKTASIIREYEKMYPKIIKPIYQTENQFSKKDIHIWSDITFPMARGKYIALCEGDDFWTDPLKLQKQVDFLEKNPEYSMCFHPVKVFFEDKKKEDYIYPSPKMNPDNFTKETLLKGNFIQTNSVMYRKKDNINIPTNIMPGDWYLHLCYAQFGKIGFINETMAAYRRHSSGMWSAASEIPENLHLKFGIQEFGFYEKVYENLTNKSKQYFESKVVPFGKYLINLFLLHNKPDKLKEFSVLYPKYYNIIETENKKTKNMKASIIIPAFNECQLTKNCLEKIYELGSDYEFEVVVIDNASSDETESFLKNVKYKNFYFIRNEENYGFAKACNQGAKKAKGEVFIFLNNDTIPTKKWLDALIKELDADQSIAIVGSKLIYPDETIQHAGIVFGVDKMPYHIYYKEKKEILEKQKKRFFKAVTGACMAIRKDDFFKFKGFDERYKNGLEDIDLCLKAGLSNKKVLYCPDSIVYHFESLTKGRGDYVKENRKLFLNIWGKKIVADDNDYIREDGYICSSRLLKNELDKKKIEIVSLKKQKDQELKFVNSLSSQKIIRIFFRVSGLFKKIISSLGLSLVYYKFLKKLRKKTFKYDFVDYGSKTGGSMSLAEKKFGGRRGLGIEIRPDCVKEAKKKGYDVILGDVTKLNLPDKMVRFTMICHFLEHLADLKSVKLALENAIRISREFVYIRGPVFDNEEYLKKLGFKVFWSDWPGGHSCHLTTKQLTEILDSLGVKDYKIEFEVEIKDSMDKNIHPIDSPSNQHEYDSQKHPPKKLVKFDRKIYREFVCIAKI